MSISDNYMLIQRDVKHARLKVHEDGKIRVIIPQSFTDNDVQDLIIKKQKWIEKKLSYFQKMVKINLHRNQLLLFGNRYTYYNDSSIGKNIVLDHKHRTIRTEKNLLDLEIQEKWYRDIARNYLSKRMEKLSNELNFKYNKLYVRSQRKKWGNCSKAKNISLNWRIIKAPTFVIDYLIVHELLHTIIMKHTHKYWTLLKSYYPDYKKAISWLDTYGNSL